MNNYVEQAAKHLARNLTGKLLLVHGLLDASCHPSGLFQLLQALIQENKDFDLLVLPNGGHAWTDYGMRRAWDFLVRHLQGLEPPRAFRLNTGADGTL